MCPYNSIVSSPDLACKISQENVCSKKLNQAELVMYSQNIFLYFCLTVFSLGTLMLICTICQCTNRRQNCISALTHIAGQNVPLKLHCQASRDPNMSALKTEPEGALSDTITYQNELVPYTTVLH